MPNVNILCTLRQQREETLSALEQLKHLYRNFVRWGFVLVVHVGLSLWMGDVLYLSTTANYRGRTQNTTSALTRLSIFIVSTKYRGLTPITTPTTGVVEPRHQRIDCTSARLFSPLDYCASVAWKVLRLFTRRDIQFNDTYGSYLHCGVAIQFGQ